MIPWLDTVQCTKPFTLDDALDLYNLIRQDPAGRDHSIDVYWTKGDVVHVRLYVPHSLTCVLARDIDVVA